jgi:hypothetical protein
MKKRIGSRQRGQWLLLLVLVLFLAGCTTYTERTWLNAPGWRRAIQIGTTSIPDRAPAAVSDDGTIYVLMIDEASSRPHVVALNRQAEVIWERFLDVQLNRPDQPRILWDGAQLRLFWLDAGTLFTAALDEAGEVADAPRSLSGDLVAEGYDVAQDNSGAVAAWFGGSRNEPGIYAFAAGQLEGDPLLMDEEGITPHLEFDAEGNLHAVWIHYPPGSSETIVYYGDYADGEANAGAGAELTSMRVGITSVLEGPSFAVEDELGYLFWSIEVRTGPAAGTAETNYITFPLGAPEQVTGQEQLYVPADYDLTYEPAPEAPLNAGDRVLLGSGQAMQGGQAVPMQLETDSMYVADAVAQEGELVVAARSNVAYELRKQAAQATLLYLDDGEPVSYQLLSFTRTGTVAPAVSRDSDGYLYTTWLERGEEGGFLVYFSSSAPDIRQALSDIQAEDVGQMTVETIFGMLAGAALSPFTAILWMLAPLAVLGVTGFLRRNGNGGRKVSAGTIISLVLALIVYWMAKTLTIPGLQEYVPFSAWIPIIPQWLELPLRWGVPLFIALIALATAWHFTYRRNNQSVLYFMFIYAAADSLLTMAVYGSIIYGFF